MAREAFILRRAQVKDAPQIAAIIARMLEEPYPVTFDHPYTATEVEDWIRRLGEQGSLFIAMTTEGTIVGFSALDYVAGEPGTATLGVWVLPEYRRRGAGTALAECALDFAREAGYKRIRGRLPENNEPALSFLSAIGALVPLRNPDMRFELPLR